MSQLLRKLLLSAVDYFKVLARLTQRDVEMQKDEEEFPATSHKRLHVAVVSDFTAALEAPCTSTTFASPTAGHCACWHCGQHWLTMSFGH